MTTKKIPMRHGTTISRVIFMFFHHIFRLSSTACFLKVYLQSLAHKERLRFCPTVAVP
jgi:hypothetical protein